MDFFLRQRQQGKLLSKLFAVPGFGTSCCKVDFLHCCDLGITSDWMGSLLSYIQSEKIRGASKLVRCTKLFADIDAWYRSNNAQDRLPKLLPTMLREEVKGKIKSPKLRAKAGEARTLVPCVLHLAETYLDETNVAELRMLRGCMELQTIYSNLSMGSWNTEHFQDAAQRFLLLNGSLETHFEADKLFRVKPKAHLLLELARQQSTPSATWTYRDESFGHTVATLANRRGGKYSVKAISNAVLRRFMASNELPKLRA